MNAGIDIGYRGTKAVSHDKTAVFLSVVGKRSEGFGLNAVDGIQFDDPEIAVGEIAAKYSQFDRRVMDREWYFSDVHEYLRFAAISELTDGCCEMNLVAGLPAKYWEKDREEVKKIFSREHTFKRAGRKQQTVKVSARIVPQGVGALFNYILDAKGHVRKDREALAEGHIGVIDPGGNTTNIIHVNGLVTERHETDTFPVGGWDIVATLKSYLTDKFRDLYLRDYEVEALLKKDVMMYQGKKVDISEEVREAKSATALQILALASQKWKSPGSMDMIFITGGTSEVLGDLLVDAFPQGQLDADPIFGNARGYLKYASR